MRLRPLSLLVLFFALAATSRCYCGADGPPRPPKVAPAKAPQPAPAPDATPATEGTTP